MFYIIKEINNKTGKVISKEIREDSRVLINIEPFKKYLKKYNKND